MDDLWVMAEAMGLRVVERRGSRAGGYHEGSSTVRLNPGLSRRVARSVLAHEIAHHVLGHVPSPFGLIQSRQERSAMEWAALRLIDMGAFGEAEEARGGHAPAMAYDLGVSVELVYAYQQALVRDGLVGAGRERSLWRAV